MKNLIIMLVCLLATSGAMADDGTDSNAYIRELVAEMQYTLENTNIADLDSWNRKAWKQGVKIKGLNLKKTGKANNN